MADEPDFIERIESTWKNWRGEEWSPEKTLQNLPLYGPGKRAEAMDQFDAELRNADTSNLRRYSELTNLYRRANRIHQELLKDGL